MNATLKLVPAAGDPALAAAMCRWADESAKVAVMLRRGLGDDDALREAAAHVREILDITGALIAALEHDLK